MTILVIGKPDSGKSLLAEELTLQTGCARRYYLATMKIMDRDGADRVKRHRRQREGKGFVTIERPLDITGAVAAMECPAEAAVLLECVSNLAGNELYDDPENGGKMPFDQASRQRLAEKIVREIEELAGQVHDLIIVSAAYEQDGEDYDEDTRNYVRLLDLVNELLSDRVDEVRDLRR
ncbi:MAG: bifunctional adenosylcobinamide kinase/adenosylcobinamide-phosphate guanylyltransferase [Lachnospiraceae bacterium]|nr:bifunctional adenosylcobinamide kinase/adenosylcobinamide-phosphate guanylyltransferase [Lachnospiraceae bacterium]